MSERRRMLASLSRAGAISILFAFVCTGCMSAAVFDYRGDDPPPSSYGALPVALAVNDLAIPRVVILNDGFGDVRLDALEERLAELLRDSQIVTDVRRSRDLSRDGIGSPGFVVQYRVESYSTSTSEDAGGVAASIIAMVLTAGLGFGGMYAVTQRHEHRLQIETRLYRADDSRLVSMSAPRSAERVAQYDTAGAELVWRGTREILIRSGHCVTCQPGGADADRFHREEGRQMARSIFDGTATDLREQMRNALASRPAAPAIAQQAVTAGGESPEFEATVRAHLDERAARILLCANADAAAVIVEWSGPGAAAISVRDAGEDTTGCVRSAVGEVLAPPGTPAGRVLHVISR